ncbi:hypothetical protein AOLI_G00194380 [Acnodon oligacanthus]
MVEQFKQGMNSCGKLWENVERYWNAFQCLFTHTEGPLTRAAFRCLFDVIWSDEGTNNKEAEEDTVFAWECLPNSVQGKIHHVVTVKLIMLLCTFYFCSLYLIIEQYLNIERKMFTISKLYHCKILGFFVHYSYKNNLINLF